MNPWHYILTHQLKQKFTADYIVINVHPVKIGTYNYPFSHVIILIFVSMVLICKWVLKYIYTLKYWYIWSLVHLTLHIGKMPFLCAKKQNNFSDVELSVKIWVYRYCWVTCPNQNSSNKCLLYIIFRILPKMTKTSEAVCNIHDRRLRDCWRESDSPESLQHTLTVYEWNDWSEMYTHKYNGEKT